MRVNGNGSPSTILLESFDPIQGFVELRLRENIKQLSENLYEYDEYIFHIRDGEGLLEDVENNLEDWFATGRILEVNESASIILDMMEALNILGVNTNEN